MNFLDILNCLTKAPKKKKLSLPGQFGKITKLVQDSQEKMISIAQDLITNMGSRVRKETKKLPTDVSPQIRKHPLYVSPGAVVTEVIRDYIDITIFWEAGKQRGKIIIPIECANEVDDFFDEEIRYLEDEMRREIKKIR